MVLTGKVILNDLAANEADLSLSIGLAKSVSQGMEALGACDVRHGLDGEWMKFFLLS